MTEDVYKMCVAALREMRLVKKSKYKTDEWRQIVHVIQQFLIQITFLTLISGNWVR